MESPESQNYNENQNANSFTTTARSVNKVDGHLDRLGAPLFPPSCTPDKISFGSEKISPSSNPGSPIVGKAVDSNDRDSRIELLLVQQDLSEGLSSLDSKYDAFMAKITNNIIDKQESNAYVSDDADTNAARHDLCMCEIEQAEKILRDNFGKHVSAGSPLISPSCTPEKISFGSEKNSPYSNPVMNSPSICTSTTPRSPDDMAMNNLMSSMASTHISAPFSFSSSMPFVFNLVRRETLIDSNQFKSSTLDREFNDFYLELVGTCKSITEDLHAVGLNIFTEKLFQNALLNELRKNNNNNRYKVLDECVIQLKFRGETVSSKRMDLLVQFPDFNIILELKYAKSITPEAKAQLKDYVTCMKNLEPPHHESRFKHCYGIIVLFLKEKDRNGDLFSLLPPN